MEHLSDDEKKKMYSLFKNIKPSELEDGINKSLNSDILIADGLNLFIRAWAVSPTLSNDGLHAGGISGSLKSLGYAIKLLNPTRCILVFDGAGGSQKRKKIFPEYKEHRANKIRINRAYADNITDDDEQKGIKKQLLRFVQYLDLLPITTMSIDNVEADDTIAYIAQEYSKKGSNVTIMSADKDFLQLVNDKIKVWSPTKKKLYGCAEVFGEYGISCENFINYRIMDGDASDNIDGIKGAGLKTIKKCFPILEENHKYDVQELLNYCDNHKGKYKLYDSVLEGKDKLSRNYQLMQLYNTQIQSFSQLRIDEILNKPIPKLNKMEFLLFLRNDKLWDSLPNVYVWINEVFSQLNHFAK